MRRERGPGYWDVLKPLLDNFGIETMLEIGKEECEAGVEKWGVVYEHVACPGGKKGWLPEDEVDLILINATGPDGRHGPLVTLDRLFVMRTAWFILLNNATTLKWDQDLRPPEGWRVFRYTKRGPGVAIFTWDKQAFEFLRDLCHRRTVDEIMGEQG